MESDQCLALSLDSTYSGARDTYQIGTGKIFTLTAGTKIATGPRGTSNIAIAVSEQYDAVALLNKDGILLHLGFG